MSLIIYGNSHSWCFRPLFPGDPDDRSGRVVVATNAERAGDARTRSGQRVRLARALGELTGSNASTSDDLAEVRLNAGVELVLTLAGNHHFVLVSRYQKDRPIDFVLPQEPDLDLIDGATLVPYHSLYQNLQVAIRPYFEAASRLRSWLGSPIYHLEVPPPMIDADEIKRQLDRRASQRESVDRPVSEDRNEFQGLSEAPPLLRYKLWRTSARVFSDLCEEHGLIYVPVPNTVLSKCGRYLRPGLNDDLTHGNAKFASLYLDHLREEWFELEPSPALLEVEAAAVEPVSESPYDDQPDRAYWRRSVADLPPRRVDPVGTAGFRSTRTPAWQPPAAALPNTSRDISRSPGFTISSPSRRRRCSASS